MKRRSNFLTKVIFIEFNFNREVLKVIVRFFCLVTIVLYGSIYSQNVISGGLDKLFYNSDSLKLDEKNIGFGFHYSLEDIKIYNNPNEVRNTHSSVYSLGYYRYYIPEFNNKNDFILLNAVALKFGKTNSNFNGKNKEVKLFSFAKQQGVGYRFAQFDFIPYVATNNTRNSVDEFNLNGNEREIGVKFKMFNHYAISLSYNQTIYQHNSKFLLNMASTTLENIVNVFINKGIAYVLPDNKLYPVYYWITNIAYKFLMIGINRKNHQFPFDSDKHYENKSFNISGRFELNL